VRTPRARRAWRSREVFRPAVLPSAVTRLVLLGQGPVIRERYARALQDLLPLLVGVAVCSIEPGLLIPTLPFLYFQVLAGDCLPLEALHRGGFLTPTTLWVVATPSWARLPYALQVAPHCRVALEKPVARNSAEARVLLRAGRGAGDVYPVDHKLFNADALAAVAHYRAAPAELQEVRHVAGFFFEQIGVALGRQQEDAIADCQWHLLTVLVAVCKARGVPFKVVVDDAEVAAYAGPVPPGFAAPAVWTASRLRGRVLWADGSKTTFDFRQGKGLPQDRKSLHLLGPGGRPLRLIDLGESGWLAHGRILEELLKPVPDVRQDLADAVAVMAVVDAGRAAARRQPDYPFGALPDFLND
jgi:predicted dehydrogenase